MAKQEKGYTPDQIKDAEKLCQLMQKVPDAKRQGTNNRITVFLYSLEPAATGGYCLIISEP